MMLSSFLNLFFIFYENVIWSRFINIVVIVIIIFTIIIIVSDACWCFQRLFFFLMIVTEDRLICFRLPQLAVLAKILCLLMVSKAIHVNMYARPHDVSWASETRGKTDCVY